MSDTPRTDEHWTTLPNGSESALHQMQKFSRTLERENNTLRAAQKACADCDAPTSEQFKQWKTMAQEFGRVFHNYPCVPSHQKCLDALSKFVELNK